MRIIPRKKLYSPLNNYDDALYSGLEGYVMRVGHRLLELDQKSCETVLEIGPGSQPHFQWMDCSNIKKYIVHDESFLLDMIEPFGHLPHDKIFKIPLSQKEKLDQLAGKVDRIIINHVLEHIVDPEGFLLWCTALLDECGSISIGLPCDPGLLWRFGQIISMKRSIKIYGYKNRREKDLMWSREHINAIQRILAIIRFYYPKSRIRWYPLLLPIINLNLICAITLQRKNFVGN